MSHELRTPLNAIIGFSSILAGEGGISSEKSLAKTQEYASMIKESGTHLLSIINGLLDLSKIEAGKQDFQDEEIDIGYEIDTCLKILQNLATEKKIELTRTIPQDDLILNGDTKILRQMLINLISNSIKYSEIGCYVKVSASVGEDNGINISVVDNGNGMSQADLSIAKEPFGRSKQAIMSDTPGTGLGLPLVEAYVKLHQGKLDMHSELGKGTTMTLSFPPERSVLNEIR
jgi:signal transduction histidine kinase